MPHLSSTYGVRTLLLFGSYARGEQTAASDVDLLAEFSRPITLFGLGSLQAHMEGLLGRRVDVGALDGLRPQLRHKVMSEARRVA
jgi:predicted nucleotidyltransferase